MTVLVADSQTASRRSLVPLVKAAFGTGVTEVEHGADVLGAMAGGGCSAAFLAHDLPGVSGEDLVAALRRSADLPQIPIAVIADDAPVDRVKRLIALGVADYILRPIDPPMVASRLRRLAARQPMTSRAQAAPRPDAFLPQGARVVVAEGDPELRRLVVAALREQFAVVQAESGVAAFRACLDRAPAAIVLGNDLGAIRRVTLMAQIKRMDRMQNVRFVALGPIEPGERGDVPVDATIRRSFVAETLAREAAALVAPRAGMDALRAAGVRDATFAAALVGAVASRLDERLVLLERDEIGSDAYASRQVMLCGSPCARLSCELRLSRRGGRLLASHALDLHVDFVEESDVADVLASLQRDFVREFARQTRARVSDVVAEAAPEMVEGDASDGQEPAVRVHLKGRMRDLAVSLVVCEGADAGQPVSRGVTE